MVDFKSHSSWVSVCVIMSLTLAVSKRHRTQVADTNCHTKLGVANSGIFPVYWMYSSDGNAFRGRLHQNKAWRSHKELYHPENRTHGYAWIQVDLHKKMVISGIQTQGDPLEDSWTTDFHVHYSSDCESFTSLLDGHGYTAQFHGNYDRNTIVTNFFHDVIVTRCIRVMPTYVEGNHTSMRLELLGCNVGICKEAVIQHMSREEFEETLDIGSSGSEPGVQSHQPKLTKTTIPTLVTRSFAEFKLHTEHIVFGCVVYMKPGTKRDSKYIVTYSRNCYTWEPVREKKGYGDPKTFVVHAPKFRSAWLSFPYPVRAHCIRLIPIWSKKGSIIQPKIKAQFIGCGTGSGIIHKCGIQKGISSIPAQSYIPNRSRSRWRRVVGGSPSDPGAFPWLVSLAHKDQESGQYMHVCGASLIHPQWVLTAAHCLNVIYAIHHQNYTRNFTLWNTPYFLSQMRLRAGEFSLNLEEGTSLDAQIEVAFPHVSYNVSYYIYDIALLKLKKPVRLSDHVNTVCLAPNMDSFPNGTECVVVGWGANEVEFPARPHQVAVPLVDHDECQDMYKHLTITEDMLCAAPEDGGKDACTGDSGGPLLCPKDDQWYQVGVASWNIGCGKAGYPGVYSKVVFFQDWISDIISQNS